MSNAKVTINGQVIEVPDGTTVLKAARQAGIDIPTLCDHPALASIGACRMCLIEVMGQRSLQTACTFPVFDGMVIQTESQRVKDARKLVLDMIFSERNHFCMYCEASGNCELQDLGYRYNLNHWAYPYVHETVSGRLITQFLSHGAQSLCPVLEVHTGLQ